MQILKKLVNPIFYNLIEKTKLQFIIRTKKLDSAELLELLKTYYLKLSSGYVKRYLPKILNEKLIEFAFAKDKPISGYAYITENPIEGDIKFVVILPIPSSADIKFDCGNNQECIDKINEIAKEILSDNIKDVIYSLYQEMIRWAVLKHFNEVKYDEDVLKLVAKIFGSIIVKIFGKRYVPSLDEDVVKMIVLVSFFVIAVDLLKFEPKQALTYTIEVYGKSKQYGEITKRFEKLIKGIKYEKYASFKTIANLFDELHLISISPIKFNYIISQEIGIKNYIDMIASIGGMISNMVIAKYPVEYISKKIVVADLNDRLEDLVVSKYLAKTF